MTDTRKERIRRAAYRLTKSEACVTGRQQANKEKSSVHLVQLLFHHHSTVLMLKECASHTLLSTSFYFPPNTSISWRIHGFQRLLLESLELLGNHNSICKRFRLRSNSCSQSSDTMPSDLEDGVINSWPSHPVARWTMRKERGVVSVAFWRSLKAISACELSV